MGYVQTQGMIAITVVPADMTASHRYAVVVSARISFLMIVTAGAAATIAAGRIEVTVSWAGAATRSAQTANDQYPPS
jgi:hypothetical protein